MRPLLLVDASCHPVGKTGLNASAIVSKTGGSHGLSIRIEKFTAVVLESEQAEDNMDDHGCYKMHWVPDTALLDTKSVQELCLRATAGPKATLE